MPEQDEKFSRKEYYLIGLEEKRHNNNIKVSNTVENNKIINGVSLGLLFTFLRFKTSFSGLEFPFNIGYIGFLLPVITILSNMIAFYPTQLSFDRNEEIIVRMYHKYSTTAHLIKNPAITVALILEIISHTSFFSSLLFAAYLLYKTFGG